MNTLKAALTALALAFFISPTAHAAKYVADKAHTFVGFKVKHMVINTVHGNFKDFEASFDFDPKTKKLANIEAKIDVDSINTNIEDRDNHLKSPDFFGVRSKDKKIVEAKRYITFKSTNVVNKKGEPDKVYGKLTMNGVTRDITLDVDYNGEVKGMDGKMRVGFEADVKIDRYDYDLKYNSPLEGGGLLIGKEIKIEIEGEAVLQN